MRKFWRIPVSGLFGKAIDVFYRKPWERAIGVKGGAIALH
jgi:hypothetical protein